MTSIPDPKLEEKCVCGHERSNHVLIRDGTGTTVRFGGCDKGCSCLGFAADARIDVSCVCTHPKGEHEHATPIGTGNYCLRLGCSCMGFRPDTMKDCVHTTRAKHGKTAMCVLCGFVTTRDASDFLLK